MEGTGGERGPCRAASPRRARRVGASAQREGWPQVDMVTGTKGE